MDALAAEAVGVFQGLAGEANGGALAGETDDLDVVPGDAVAQAGSDGLEAGFFGGKAGGQAFGGVGLGQAIAELFRGKNTAKEALPKALYGGLDPGDFGDVNSCAYNHLRRYAKVSYLLGFDSKVTLISKETTQDFAGYNVRALFQKRCTAALHQQPACTTL